MLSMCVKALLNLFYNILHSATYDFYLQDPREKLILSLKREVKLLRNENHYLRERLKFPKGHAIQARQEKTSPIEINGSAEDNELDGDKTPVPVERRVVKRQSTNRWVEAGGVSSEERDREVNSPGINVANANPGIPFLMREKAHKFIIVVCVRTSI